MREYGVFLPEGIRHFRNRIPEVLEDAQNKLTPLAREFTADQYARLGELDRRITDYDARINVIFRDNDTRQRLMAIDGVGPMTATALIAAAGNDNEFKNSRHFAAWLGLVPRQHSSGERNKLLGISKRGNTYLRTLLIHGSRSVSRRCKTRIDKRGRWIQAIMERRGFNRACVALANKIARIL